MIQSSTEKCRVLIVDDDHRICDLLSELLTSESYEVVTAADGRGALELLSSFEPDVVISDVAMPVLDGVELCRQIKQNDRTANIPVILISGSRYAAEDSLEGLIAGADDYLQLPFRNEELLVKVARLAERRRVEKHYKGIVEDAADIIYTRDMNGYIRSINAAGAKLFKRPASEIVGCHLSEFIGVADANRDIEQAQRAAPDLPLRSTYHLKDGEENGKYLEGLINIERDRQGRPTGIRGVIRDISEQKIAEAALREREAALRENEQRYRELFENASDIIYSHTLTGDVTSLNRTGQKITGYSEAEALRMNIVDVLAPEYVSLAQQMMTHKADANTPTVYELDIITKHGRRVRLEVSTRLIHRDGKPIGVQGIGRDLSERKRSEEVLAHQAQREAMTHRISQAIRCSLDSSEIFQTAVQELGSYLGADRCSLFIKDQTGSSAVIAAEYHAAGVIPAASKFELEDLQVLIAALEAKGVLCFNDAANDARIADVYERILSPVDVKSIMYLAIRVGDEVTAAFALSTTRSLRTWSASDVALAKAVADQTGIAIRQADLFQRAEATSKREVLINKVTLAIRASLSLTEVLNTATRELGLALEASRVHLHLYNPENPISPVEHEYLAPGCKSIGPFQANYEDPVGQQYVHMTRPLVIRDSLNYQDGPAEVSAAVRAHAQLVGVRSQISYPLIIKGLFRGVLCIHQADRLRHWTEDELSLVQSVAERLAVGMAQAELFEMVAKAKSEWEATFDAMADGIFIFDRAGRLKRVNRAGAALEDAQPRDLLGRRCCDILRATFASSGCVVEKAIAEGTRITIEVTPDRLERPVLVSIEPVVDKQGAVISVVCTARDLSELRQVQAVAREHQSLLTNILESARESIYAVDLAGRFKWCNRATLLALGLKREELIGRHLLELVHEVDREATGEKLALALAGEPQTYEMRFTAADRQLRYARVDNSPLVVEGQTTGVLGIARDITEQKEERERAARADKLRALGQLASGVAHDFNNSLAAILGRAQLLHRQTRDEALVRNIEIIQTAAEDAAATVRRIQTFARKSPAREFEMVDVTSLLNDAIEITRTRWENEARLRGLEYQVVLAAEGGQHTFGSASELREVFVNLIVNAVDAMPTGGRLSIGTATEGSRLRLRFADTGVGMPEDVRQKIFDPFFTTKGAQGTGLGLSVSHSIIERHEGSISVGSEVGAGTVFTIDLPAKTAQAVSTEVSTAPLEARPLSILVIDDEPAVRETLAEMLQVMGHHVVLAESGQIALQTLAGRNFDLVFTDLAMPEMDGWETSREIRKRWPELSVVLVTGYGTGTAPPPGEDGLVNGIIGKPFDFSQIRQMITGILASEPLLENAGAS